jgi:hypothetical protein
MNRKWGVVAVSVLAFAFTATAMAAPKGLSQAEAEALIKGNTAEGVNRFKKNMIWYFDASGELRKKDDLGNKGKAKWNINKQGKLCYQDKHMKSENCAAILPRADGGYDVPFDAQWNWQKITPGNPHNL